jgi:hypothetical protein
MVIGSVMVIERVNVNEPVIAAALRQPAVRHRADRAAAPTTPALDHGPVRVHALDQDHGPGNGNGNGNGNANVLFGVCSG